MKPSDWRRSPIGKYLRHLPRVKQIRGSWLHRHFGDRILHPSLWQVDRRRFAGGFAIGSFFAMVPFPTQMLLAGACACLTRTNIAVAIAATWISNPFTTPFILYVQYRIGKFFIGGNMEFSASSHWENFWVLARHAPAQIILGAFITGVASAAIAYPMVILFWNTVMRLLVIRQSRSRSGKKAS